MADYDSSLPIRTENDGDVVSKIADATTPANQLTVESDGSINTRITDGTDTLGVNADGSIDVNFASGSAVEITDGTDTLAVNADGSINAVVTATDLDIRDLSATQDNVAISDGTDTLAVNADGSINATVTATDLDIRDLDSATDSVEVLQATHDDLNANANMQVGNVDVANGNPVPVSDAGGSLTVDATDLDIRDLSATQDNVAISDGTDTLAINSDGSINVVVDETAGDEVIDYNTSSSVASSAVVNHDYTVTAGKTFSGKEIWVSGSGKLRCLIQLETAPASGTYTDQFVAFNSTASPNIRIPICYILQQSAGANVRIKIQNRDTNAQDVYSTLIGKEA